MTPIMICEKNDIIIVPFPFVDNSNYKPRPALVLSHIEFNRSHQHTILAMITTGTDTSWKSDIVVTDIKEAGLNVPSFIRMKLFTLDNQLIKRKIGTLSRTDVAKMTKAMMIHLFGQG